MDSSMSRRTSLLAISMVMLLIAGQYASAEIPHENFDLVDTDLYMVTQLLDQGINVTELALVACLEEKPLNGSRNLTRLDSILIPVSDLITQIQGVASSYYSLNYLTPPFENLSIGGHRFTTNQSSFLVEFRTLKSYAGKPLSASEVVDAQRLMATVRSKIFAMNSDLDVMDGAATAIADLTVKGEYVFNTTYLKELIDRLRIMLAEYLEQLESLFFIIQWGGPFILMVVDKTYYYLGETVRIAGYLFNGPEPQKGKPVDIWKDQSPLITVITNNNGAFSAGWTIPINKVELGHHNITARAVVEGESLFDTREIIVLKIPTNLTLRINSYMFEPGELIITLAHLEDYKNRPLGWQSVIFRLDNKYTYQNTSANGQTVLMLNSSYLDWGKHFVNARFEGTDIYVSSKSQTLYFDNSLSTSLKLTLSANIVKQGENVTMTSILSAQNSKFLPNREIKITMDDMLLTTGLTDENGSLAFVLNTTGIPAGTYIITAIFVSQELRYDDATSKPQLLTIYVPSSGESDKRGLSWWDELTAGFSWLLLLIVIIIILIMFMLSRDAFDKIKPVDSRKKVALETKEAAADTAQTASEELPAPELPVSEVVSGIDFSIMHPRAAIVKRYGMLLDSLKALRGMPIQDSMTAREIGDLLKRAGYPATETLRLTRGFERAMYSAQEMTRKDWEEFSKLAELVQAFEGGS